MVYATTLKDGIKINMYKAINQTAISPAHVGKISAWAEGTKEQSSSDLYRSTVCHSGYHQAGGIGIEGCWYYCCYGQKVKVMHED